MNIFVYLLFGHIVGDFFLQPKSMAVKKGASNRIAFGHVVIYTTAVYWFTYSFLPKGHPIYLLWYLIIFIPHFLIDRFSLADKWLKFINGRSLADFLDNGHKDIPLPHHIGNHIVPSEMDKDALEKDYEICSKWNNYLILRGAFTALVYVAVDNTSHLMCLWFGFKLLTHLFQ